MNSLQAPRHRRMIAGYLLPHFASTSSSAASAAAAVGAV